MRLAVLAFICFALVGFFASFSSAQDCYVSLTPYANASCLGEPADSGCVTELASDGQCNPVETGQSSRIHCDFKNGTFYSSAHCNGTATDFADQQCVEVPSLGVYIKAQWDMDCDGHIIDGGGSSSSSGGGDDGDDSPATFLSASSWWRVVFVLL